MRQLRDSTINLSREEVLVLRDALLEVDDIAVRGDLVDGWGSIDAWAFAKAAKKQPGLWAILNIEDAAGTFETLRRLGHGDAAAKIDARTWAHGSADLALSIVLTAAGVDLTAGGMSANAVVSDEEGRGESLRIGVGFKRYRRSDALPYYFDTMTYIAEHLSELRERGRKALRRDMQEVLGLGSVSSPQVLTLADGLRYFSEEAGNVELLRAGKTMELGAQRTPSLFFLTRTSSTRFRLEQYSTETPTERLAEATGISYMRYEDQTYGVGYAIVALANVMDAISASAEELPR